MTPRDAARAETAAVYGQTTSKGCSNDTFDQALAHVRTVLAPQPAPKRSFIPAEEIKWLRSFGWSYQRIADRFGISRDAVWKSIHGRTASDRKSLPQTREF